MHPNPTHVPVPSILPSAPVTFPPKQNLKVEPPQKKSNETKQNKQKNLGMEALAWPLVHTILLGSVHCKCS